LKSKSLSLYLLYYSTSWNCILRVLNWITARVWILYWVCFMWHMPIFWMHFRIFRAKLISTSSILKCKKMCLRYKSMRTKNKVYLWTNQIIKSLIIYVVSLLLNFFYSSCRLRYHIIWCAMFYIVSGINICLLLYLILGFVEFCQARNWVY